MCEMRPAGRRGAARTCTGWHQRGRCQGRPTPSREPDCPLFMDDRELDPARGSLASNAIPGRIVKLRSVYIFEIEPNKYHKECASRTRLHEAFQQIATGQLRRHRKETSPVRIHSKSYSFRSVLLRSSYQSFFNNESGMFRFPGEVFKQPAIPLYAQRTYVDFTNG